MIINGQRYEAEPAVEAYVKDLQAENEEQRREMLRLTDELKEMDGANEYLRNQSAKDFENVLKFMDTIGALKKENERLEEKYQKATGVIAATDCVECKAELVKHGHWIDNNNKTWSCSICQSWIPDEQHSYARYCLHCGAEMDGGENE